MTYDRSRVVCTVWRGGFARTADLRPAPSGICTEDAVVVVAEVDVVAQQRRDGLVVKLRLVDVLVHEREVRPQRARAAEIAREQREVAPLLEHRVQVVLQHAAQPRRARAQVAELGRAGRRAHLTRQRC